jgi:alkylhydroperoxidase family enzyme
MRRFTIPTTLVVLMACTSITPAQPAPKSPYRFPAATLEEASSQFGGEDVPGWALMLARPLPKTTAVMLQLDHVHRAKNPLGPALAGKLHWTAADAIGCDYARRYAEADLHRAGVKTDEFKTLAISHKLPAKDQAAFAFARKMTIAAYTVTDEEVAYLVAEYGADQVVAMVHTLAWANFRNRILLALGTQLEPDGPFAPFDPQLDPSQREKFATPPRPVWKDVIAADAPESIRTKLDWQKQTAADLVHSLESQKARKPRIALPELSKLDKLPPDAKARTAKIIWSRVSMGYQPFLTQAWFETMGTFQKEAKLDPVFSNSMFWVITRSNECFY